VTAFPAKSHWQKATGIHYVSRTDEDLMLYFSLGDFVTHPDQPDWGHGQVQSIVGKNVTVNFEHAGKQMINCQIIGLVKVNSHKRD
jgi:hypothetical protein